MSKGDSRRRSVIVLLAISIGLSTILIPTFISLTFSERFFSMDFMLISGLHMTMYVIIAIYIYSIIVIPNYIKDPDKFKAKPLVFKFLIVPIKWLLIMCGGLQLIGWVLLLYLRVDRYMTKINPITLILYFISFLLPLLAGILFTNRTGIAKKYLYKGEGVASVVLSMDKACPKCRAKQEGKAKYCTECGWEFFKIEY